MELLRTFALAAVVVEADLRRLRDTLQEERQNTPVTISTWTPRTTDTVRMAKVHGIFEDGRREVEQMVKHKVCHFDFVKMVVVKVLLLSGGKVPEHFVTKDRQGGGGGEPLTEIPQDRFGKTIF